LHASQRGERGHGQRDAEIAHPRGLAREHGDLLLGGEEDVDALLMAGVEGRLQPAVRIASVGGHVVHATYVAGESCQAEGIR